MQHFRGRCHHGQGAGRRRRSRRRGRGGTGKHCDFARLRETCRRAHHHAPADADSTSSGGAWRRWHSLCSWSSHTGSRKAPGDGGRRCICLWLGEAEILELLRPRCFNLQDAWQARSHIFQRGRRGGIDSSSIIGGSVCSSRHVLGCACFAEERRRVLVAVDGSDPQPLGGRLKARVRAAAAGLRPVAPPARAPAAGQEAHVCRVRRDDRCRTLLFREAAAVAGPGAHAGPRPSFPESLGSLGGQAPSAAASWRGHVRGSVPAAHPKAHADHRRGAPLGRAPRGARRRCRRHGLDVAPLRRPRLSGDRAGRRSDAAGHWWGSELAGELRHPARLGEHLPCPLLQRGWAAHRQRLRLRHALVAPRG
mmetsp:Transcript_85427/g.245315  ORF Transcript_85427/g.245315 Transcript_85427/m.245315 type:complete len:365 (-) Transcript_85427:144-1238(-)